MGHIVLDLTNLAYQPMTKSREQSGHPRRHVTFNMSERKTAYPTHTEDTHEDENDQHLVQPTSRIEPAEERCEPAIDDNYLAPFGSSKKTASMARPNYCTGAGGVR